jgi:hypothetical protein
VRESQVNLRFALFAALDDPRQASASATSPSALKLGGSQQSTVKVSFRLTTTSSLRLCWIRHTTSPIYAYIDSTHCWKFPCDKGSTTRNSGPSTAASELRTLRIHLNNTTSHINSQDGYSGITNDNSPLICESDVRHYTTRHSHDKISWNFEETIY